MEYSIPPRRKVEYVTILTQDPMDKKGLEPTPPSDAEAIMLIVPTADNLAVEVKVNPQDIEQVRLGQRSWLRFPTAKPKGVGPAEACTCAGAGVPSAATRKVSMESVPFSVTMVQLPSGFG